ncbi:MAG: acyl-CoA carboxylase subunit beta [Deltaproteobacteria bacterium]|nr:acyl-CoA carboxylase subunit beta [Deltaproteobacteria bacterium]MBW2339374.1 acyl-CoA carboxylase subunit beta [Deltaproteobacteria bacterium]
MLMKNKIKELQRRRSDMVLGGGQEKINAQHKKEKLTARERIDKLLDPDTFVELGLFAKHRCTQLGMEKKELPADGVVTGYGEIQGRTVFIYSQDFTVMGGSAGPVHQKKMAETASLAYEASAPLIGLYDSAGARLQEGSENITFARLFCQNARCSGVIPQIAAILGPSAGGSVYSPALMDFIIMVKKTSFMFITGPATIKAVTHEESNNQALGGSAVHCRKSGVADLEAEDDDDCIENIKTLLSYLPSSCFEKPPRLTSQDDPHRLCPKLEEIVPGDRKKVYDVRLVINEIVDEGSFFEIKDGYARNMVIGFARVDGQSVGVIANQPRVLGGTIDIDASDKAARFIQILDAFNIPIVTLMDTPAFLPGINQEHGGIIRHGAKMLYAYSEATVPMVTIILRKAYGGGWSAMGPKELGIDLVFAWPTAECASMGPEGAAEVIWAKEIQSAPDPKAAREKFIKEYDKNFANPYLAAALRVIDDVIYPAETRRKIIQALRMLEKKQRPSSPRKHGIMPV